MSLEYSIRSLGGLLALVNLGIIYSGILHGMRRQGGRTSGRATVWLRSAAFYLFATVLFISMAWLGWSPLPLEISSQTSAVMLAAGSLLFFPGMGLVLWGRLALGRNYFVSTGIGAQLFADQQLVTTGPYAIVRHPMYTGLVLSALGALLMYTNYLDDCILLVIRPLSGSTRTAKRTGIGG